MRAQITTGAITGQVLDASGAPVPTATVSLTNTGTQATRQATSNDAGEYTFTFLAPGSYSLKVEAVGFQTALRSDIQVQVNVIVRANVALQPGVVKEIVEVQSGALTLQTETAEVGNVVEHQAIVDLPLNGRNFIDLVALQPGSVSTAKTANGGVSYLSNLFGGSYSVHGAPADGTNFLLDGVDMRDTVDTRVGFEMTVDAIQEFKFQALDYSAAFGRGSGGQINVASRSGTNQFHGSLWEFLRNDKLDARNFFNAGKPPYRQNQFGGALGGPIRKDATFFFVSYEGFRSRKSISKATTVPTVAQRNGDFTGSPAIFNPLSVDAAGLRAPFAGNQIPASFFSPVAVNSLKQLYPLPNLTGAGNNFLATVSQSTDTDQVNGRIDQRLRATDNLFGRFTYVRVDRGVPLQYSNFPQFLTVWNSPARNAVIGETHTFGPGTMNEFRFGYNRTVQLLDEVVANREQIPQQLGITGLTTDRRLLGDPMITIAGMGTTGTISNAPNNRSDNIFVWLDNFSHLVGKHTLSTGFQAERSQQNGGANPGSHGGFSFTGVFTAQLTPTGTQAGTGAAAADFLLGFPNSSNRCCLTGDGFRNFRKTDMGFYFQDDWKVSANLTVNLGLRYELFLPASERRDRYSQPDLSAAPQAKINIAGQNGVPRGLRSTDLNDFAPRVGFAYSLGPNRKTVIRGGYGIFYNPQQLILTFGMSTNPPFVDRQSFLSSSRTPQLTLANAFPGNLGIPSLTFSAVDPNLRDPYNQNWNLAVQRDVGAGTVVSVTYIGNKGVKLPVGYDVNLPDPGPGAVAARRPIPALSGISMTTNQGKSIYHGLELKGERRFSEGLSFNTSFVWSKCIDVAGVNTTYDGGVGAIRNPRDSKLNRGLCNSDVRRRFVTSLLYRLPFGNHMTGYRRRFLAGWEAASIVTLEGGQPFSAKFPTDNSNTGRFNDTPDAVPGQDPNNGPRTPNRWFNVNAFQAPQPLTFGNTGRNIIIGPGVARLDLSLHKDIQLTERHALEFRTEFFNAINHANFFQPANVFATANFGVIASAFDGRDIQFSLKYKF